jgi:uncharacterized protein (DUF2237 family)
VYQPLANSVFYDKTLHSQEIINMDFDRNVLGGPLETCGLSPPTGFSRDGKCRLSAGDTGKHGVCSAVTDDFLRFTQQRGNDLSTPNELFGFPGLKPGDLWCLCISRWKEALRNGMAPPVVLKATSEAVLKSITLSELSEHALDE